MMSVRVKHDAGGVYVYQAFTEFTARHAVQHQTFVKGCGFSFDRMSWPKFSYGWMVYRCGFAHKARQERVLEIKTTHAFINEVLRSGVFSSFDQSALSDKAAWRKAMSRSDIVLQWDPDRDLLMRRTEHRTLQFGLRGDMLRRYAEEGILRIRDITCEVYEAEERYLLKQDVPSERAERDYTVTHEAKANLGL